MALQGSKGFLTQLLPEWLHLSFNAGLKAGKGFLPHLLLLLLLLCQVAYLQPANKSILGHKKPCSPQKKLNA